MRFWGSEQEIFADVAWGFWDSLYFRRNVPEPPFIHYSHPHFSGARFTSAQHNILSKPLAAFPHNNRRNNGMR